MPPIDDPTPSQPLLETRDLVIGEGLRLVVGTMTVDGPRIACEGSAHLLVRALADRRLIHEGQVTLCGRPAEDSLRDRTAAYVPRSLPLPSATRVLDAIVLSGRLVGADRNDAEHALSLCRMGAHQKKKLGELSRLQRRLVALAHGICASPNLLILEDLYRDLDEPEIEIIEAILDTQLDERNWIAAVDQTSPGSRSLLLRASRVLVGAGTQVLPPQNAAQLPSDGFWVTCSSDAGVLAERLQQSGARVTRSPHPAVLLVRDARGQAIFRAARDCGTSIVELSPQPRESISPTRATSGA